VVSERQRLFHPYSPTAQKSSDTPPI